VVQTAVVHFVEWMQDPHSDVSYTAQAFELVPQDLRQRIALRHSVDMVRVTMEFFEEVGAAAGPLRRAVDRPHGGHSEVQPRPGVHRRDGYANAAEARGTWDSRMEASVVDAVVRGDTGPDCSPAPQH
jgi:hypothetical protein